MDIRVSAENEGRTVKSFIQTTLHTSSKMLKYLKFRENGICVNGKKVTVRQILHEGDLLSLAIDDSEESEKIRPVKLPLAILYEDEDLVIPSKPANMPTHPSHDHYDDTVANALAYRYQKLGVPFVFRPINRLDRNTSGLLLIARNKLSAGRLTETMQEGKIRKTYIAVLDGEMELGDNVIDQCLHRTADSIIVREVCAPDAPDADRAITKFRVLYAENGHSLVVAFPITGRTHQLRVHFASLGHPITGDDLYGTPSKEIPRHALHARTLHFPHPSDGHLLTVTAPFPEDFQRILDRYFSGKEICDELFN